MIDAPLANRSAEVDAFMHTLAHPLTESVQNIRLGILASDARVTEHIKWKAPSFCRDNDDRVTFQLRHPQRIQLIFHRGAKVKDIAGFTFADTSGLIQWAATDRGIVTFAIAEDVAARKDDLLSLILRWMDATTN